MIDTVPPGGHIADAAISLRSDGDFELVVGTAEFGNGTSTVHQQIAATALATTVDRIHLRQSDTANGGHDTGAYGSTGTFVAGRATQAAAEHMSRLLCDFVCDTRGLDPATCKLDAGFVVHGELKLSYVEIAKDAHARRKAISAKGTSSGTPRSVAFNVQGFRVAVNRNTGQVNILNSIHAADAGRVANPMQCRGQIEGGVAQAIGTALYEEVIIDELGPRGEREISRLPRPDVCRPAAHRCLLRANDRSAGSIRRKVDE